MKRFRAWTQQPTTVAGLATILGTLSALLSHQLSWSQAGPLMLAACVSIIIPDNTGASTTPSAAPVAVDHE